MRDWLRRGLSRDRPLLVARIAWPVLYPFSLGLVVASMASRYRELTVVDAGMGSLLVPAGGLYGIALFTLELLVVIQYVANTLLMAWRRHDDWVALYTSIGGPMLLMLLLPAPEALRLAEPGWAEVVTATQWLGAAMPGAWLFFFPDGRFVPRWATSLALIWPGIWVATAFVFPGGSGLFTMPPAAIAVWSVWITGGLCAQVYRIVKVAGPVQRQQTKFLLASTWVLFIGFLFVLPARFLPLADLPPLLRPEVALPVLLVAVAGFGTGFWMAVLRYRLWDIDIVVNRSALYGTVAFVLIAAYQLLASGVEQLLTSAQREQFGAIRPILALAVIPGFRPLERRVRPIVDRLLPMNERLAFLFTDIVGSTEVAGVIGDARWRDLLGSYNAAVRRELRRFGGVEVDTTGDGFFATFRDPLSAARCALSLGPATTPLGLRTRAGLHIGECDMRGGEPVGINVHLAARVMAAAEGDMVLVSGDYRDVLIGSTALFEALGPRRLKGLPDEVHLYRITAA